MKKDEDKKLTNGMTWLYLLLTIGMGVAIFANIISIQWVNGDDWRERGAKMVEDIHDDPARRGDIYSSDGRVLITTVTKCDLYLELANPPDLDKNGRQKKDKDGNPKFLGPIVDSSYNQYLDTVCLMLSNAFPNRSAEYYHNLIDTERQKEKPSRYFLVQKGVPYSVWLDICRVPGWGRGVAKRDVMHQYREPIYGNMAHNVIGFYNGADLKTYTGLEGYYDSILRGIDGKYYRHRMTRSIWLEEDPELRGEIMRTTDDGDSDTTIITLQRRVNGSSIVATIDTRYQDIASKALYRAMFKYRDGQRIPNATSGCAILMEVETGYVLACSSLSIDPTDGDYREVHNRNVAVSDIYPPGSTFKTVALAAMLSDPGIKVDTAQKFWTYNGVHNYSPKGHRDGIVRDDHTATDSLNVRQIIEKSSNVGMAEMGWYFYRIPNRCDTLRMLMSQIFPYQKLNPDIQASQPKSSILQDMKPVSNFTRLCYGYSTAITPLQLATFYNAVAGTGRMVKPLFCRAIIDVNGKRTDIKPQVINEHVISEANARMLQTMLTGVVNNGGTGAGIKSNTYLLAGKTGTAREEHPQRPTVYHASFAGFFPADQPRYTCVVLLEGCRILTYGSQVAPVFKEIADCVMAIDKRTGNSVSQVKMEEDSAAAAEHPAARGNQRELMALYRSLGIPYISADSSSEWVFYHAETDSTRAQYTPFTTAEGRVPNCTGMTAKDAVAILHAEGYRVRVKGVGKVRTQIPRAGQSLKHGGLVEITLR